MTDWLIRGGQVVTPYGVEFSDIAIRGGKIQAVGGQLTGSPDRTLDASGLLVLPGIIDVHTHPVYLDDLGALSVTAAHGGVTTLIHFAYAKPGVGLVKTLHAFREEGEADSRLDFALHGGLFDPANQANEIPLAMEQGFTSHKLFMTYAKLGWMTDDYQLMRTMDILGRVGGMAMVHAENGLATDYLEDKANEAGEDPLESFLATRPAELEAEAVHRAAAMARVANCSLYIPHMTAELGVNVVAHARAQGQRIYAETCPQYLTLTAASLHHLGPLIKIGPPVRGQSDQEALWQALAEGSLDTIASDHAPKAKSRTDEFFSAPFGSPQVETMLSLAFHGGVHGGRLSVSRLVQLMSENPARIFGLYPQKGVIRSGSDADLVLFDPNKPHRISHSNQHSHAPYTVYEGRDVVGRVVLTMQRGEIILQNGELVASRGRARFLPTRAGQAPVSQLAPKCSTSLNAPPGGAV